MVEDNGADGKETSHETELTTHAAAMYLQEDSLLALFYISAVLTLERKHVSRLLSTTGNLYGVWVKTKNQQAEKWERTLKYKASTEVIISCVCEPDSCRCFHHQEDVNGIKKGPPEGGTEKQLDPHLQHKVDTDTDV